MVGSTCVIYIEILDSPPANSPDSYDDEVCAVALTDFMEVGASCSSSLMPFSFRETMMRYVGSSFL